jgi:hypothetical protein
MSSPVPLYGSSTGVAYSDDGQAIQA